MQLLPGGDPISTAILGKKSAEKLLTPKMPDLPAPPPPPTREDPAIAIAKKKQQAEEFRRKGRRATILSKGMNDGLGTVTRPEAKSVELLGE